MSVSLDPIVARKLQHFGRRRLWLILFRGLCAGLVTFLICMAVVAVIDWYWLLTDQARWAMSGAAYAVVVVAVWWTCLRRLVHLPARTEIAAQVEQTEPELRENLLSAVELATDDPSVLHDSPVFRSLLQGKVAQQMSRIRVPRLLPLKLVARWLVAALVVMAVATLLLTSDDPRFRQLATRAVLPGANIARISRIHVEVLQPTPHSLMLAEDETVAVVVQVTGGEVDEVTLETVTASRGSVKQSMRGRTENEFVANIHVADESVEYRILAGDAVTQRFVIESRPRPRVTAFQKTYTYPSYTQLAPQQITETHGDLIVLEGTQAELVLQLDQDVTEAELRIDLTDSEDMQVVPLIPVSSPRPSDRQTDNNDSKAQPAADASGRSLSWTATIPVDKSAIYKVHLVSKETGFENIFSPKYEIRPQPDLIPRTGFVELQETTLLLPPNDIVALKAMAEDDLPLESLEQQVSINGREWEAMPLAVKADEDSEGRRISAAWQWDLLTHQLKAGDQVTTKLVATDRKGNVGESIPLRIVVAAADFDPARHTIMERKLGLYDHLADFARLLEEHRVSALEVIERLRDPEQPTAQAALDRTTLMNLAARQRDGAAQLLQQIQDVEREMPAGADALDLELTGRVIARLHREYTNHTAWLLTTLQNSEDPARLKADLDDLKRTFERTADDAKNAAGHYQHLMAHNFLNAVGFDLDALLRQQQLVVDSPTQTWERLVRQETIVINQLRVLTRLLEDQRSRLPSGLDGHIRSLLVWAESHQSRLASGTESEDKLPQLKQASQNFYREIQQKQQYAHIDGGLPGRLIAARRDFENRTGSLYLPLEQTARAVQEENRLAAQASEAEDSAAGQLLRQQAERFVTELDLKQRHSVDQLTVRRTLTQTRRDSDAQYAADAGLTHRAVTSLLHQHRHVAPQESTVSADLQKVAPAYRILEAGHQLILTRNALKVLLQMERWNSQKIEGHMDHPRQWDVVQQGFELASQRLREAGVSRELVAQLDQLRQAPDVRDAARKLTERRWKRDAIIGAGHELDNIRTELASIVAELEPIMAEARAVIAEYAPTIPQMARQAADQLRQLEEATTAAADAAEDPAATDMQAPMSELQQQQEAVNQQVQDLFEALVEDANAQDLLDQQQRERARDADDSIAMIKPPAAQMNRAMEQAQAQDPGEQQAKNLAQAAEQQEKTAQALETVAEHFDRLDQDMDVAETRAELRQTEQEQGLASQLDQQFESSEQLAEMASSDTQELLAQLEAELQRNPAMQQALSEISRNALQEARNALEYAAQDDQNLRRANERSDAEFQQKKKELAEDLRQLSTELSQFSRALTNEARQAAARGKTKEAEAKLASSYQQLSEAAAKASQARDDQLLSDLAQTAQETQEALASATESLKQAKQQTAAGKDEKVHADDKVREAQKKDSEKRRQQFQEQQKRTARDIAKRADDAKRRADQNVRNAENQLKAAERRVQQAKTNLSRKPEDAGLKRNLAQEETRQTGEEQKVAAAKKIQEQATQDAAEAAKKQDEVNRRPAPSLDAANPATQLADQYAELALTETETMSRRAEELAKRAQFGNELTPTKNQLAAAEQQQQQVTEDVQQAANDINRAARHERRLSNPLVAEPLQNAAEQIQQVANNESKNAENQLNSAAQQAEQANAAAPAEQTAPNSEALKAQDALATAEQAIKQQAEQLTGVLDPLLAAAAEQAAASGSESSESQPAQNATAQATPPTDNASSPNASAASPTADGSPPQPSSPQGTSASSEGQPTGAPLTPAQLAEGRQLAQTLDELDRQQAAALAAPPADAGPQAPTRPTGLDTLAQAAQAQRAQLSAARAVAQQEAVMALGEGGTESSDNPSATGPLSEFEVTTVNRSEDKDWGKLRSKSAEDLTKGRTEAISEEYRKSVETYFRVLAERAKKK